MGEVSVVRGLDGRMRWSLAISRRATVGLAAKHLVCVRVCVCVFV